MNPTTTISNEKLLTQLDGRYATKPFDPQRKINPQTWAALAPAKDDDTLVRQPLGLGPVVAAAAGYRASRDKYAGAKEVRSPKTEALIEA